MKANTESDLRETSEQMATHQLDVMLQQELRKDIPDEETVLTIMEILRERDAAKPVEIDGEIRNAWADFQEGCAADHAEKVAKKRNWVMRAAAIAAVVCILIMTVPQAAGAESVFTVIARWTENMFTFFGQVGDPVEYVFKTEHPGLQEIYDAVTEAGITQPVVPMWVPDGYELTEIKVSPWSDKIKIQAVLCSDSNRIVLSYTHYVANVASEYHKDIDQVKVIEREGIIHYVMSNDGTTTIVWQTDRTECFMSSNCQEELLISVVDAIYSLEES